ncbi:xylulokinase [Nitratireductor soli]|uniref:xylulokinase n=1 Tax=Nitratireductor soli TaxID=1670619 RepID=UPI00065E8993|nr:FGGY family carbohydrate kinase [Nitratireductor soli]
MSRNVLAIDIGSSALKAVLFGADGVMLASRSRPIATVQGPDRSQTQDPDAWWRSLKEALAELPGREKISAVVCTGSMQNLIVLSPQGRPLTPAALYSDRRLEEDEISALEKRLPEDYATRTGNRLDPAHTILKLMRPDRFAPGGAWSRDMRFCFGAKDALTFRMTGRAAIDPTIASTTGLMNLKQRDWDPALVGASGVDRDVLPEILPADAVIGTLRSGPAAELGLAEGLVVFNGAGDAAAATWGASADRPGAAYAYLGTTGWVAATLSLHDAAPPRDIYTLADPIHPDRAIIISPFLTAGAAMDWLAEVTGGKVEALLAQAAELEEHPPSTLFLPYLAGERAPFEDQNVRGAFLGLDRAHGAGAMAHAVMEGVAFAIRHNLETAGLPSSSLTVIGGGARHPLQRRILADALKRGITFPHDSQEMTARGVLRMIAGKIGLQPDSRGAGVLVAPRPERTARSDLRFEAYLAASRFARDQARLLN